MPHVRFFLANTEHPIDPDHPLWHQRLPDRDPSPSRRLSEDQSPPAVTYADYFEALASLCASDNWRPIRHAAQEMMQHPVAEEEISRVSIFLEKHGAFYHPARLAVTVPGRTIALAANVAVSTAGRRTLPVETRALERLCDQRPFGWLPKVYGSTADPMPMFLADWFDDYHEFHLTRAGAREGNSLMVWDGATPPTLLSERQAADLYRKATMILAACYDPFTTDQIVAWHHAAGDFVVRVEGDTVDVKLITARGYAPLLEPSAAPLDERALLDNLIVFFIHQSIRMRLDRLDGVSEIVWAADACVAPMIDGFFNGLDLTGRLSGLPETFPLFFRDYFNHQGEAQLMKTAEHLVSAVTDRPSEERRVIDRHLERHLHQLCLHLRREK